MVTKTSLFALALLITACGTSDSSAPGETESTVKRTTVSTTTTTTTLTHPPTTTAETTTSTTQLVADPAPTIIVPPSEPPVIDGVMTADEWAGSAAVSMSDGVTAHFLHSDNTLFIGIAGKEIGAVNVVIASIDNVSILHSSAALGSAQYARSGTAWELVHGFDWCCRRGSDESARQALFNEEGWDANIGYTGEPGIVEFAVTIPWRGTALAISSINSEARNAFWPADLSAEAQDQLVGVPPQSREYSLDEWGTIEAG